MAGLVVLVSLASCAGPTWPDAKGGSAHLEVRGDLEADLDLTFLPSNSPSGEPEWLWTDAEAEEPSQLFFSAEPFTGVKVTSPEFVVSLALLQRDPGHRRFSSAAGECSVNVTEASSEALHGEISCEGLRAVGGDEVVSIEGTFEATANSG